MELLGRSSGACAEWRLWGYGRELVSAVHRGSVEVPGWARVSWAKAGITGWKRRFLRRGFIVAMFDERLPKAMMWVSLFRRWGARLTAVRFDEPSWFHVWFLRAAQLSGSDSSFARSPLGRNGWRLGLS